MRKSPDDKQIVFHSYRLHHTPIILRRTRPMSDQCQQKRAHSPRSEDTPYPALPLSWLSNAAGSVNVCFVKTAVQRHPFLSKAVLGRKAPHYPRVTVSLNRRRSQQEFTAHLAATPHPTPQILGRSLKPPFWKVESEIRHTWTPDCPPALKQPLTLRSCKLILLPLKSGGVPETSQVRQRWINTIS